MSIQTAAPPKPDSAPENLKAAGERPAPASAVPTDNLNKTQEMVVDAVSEMLAHGGRSEEIDQLLHAAMKHRFHRELAGMTFDRIEERDRLVTKWINEGFNEWKTDLAIAWRANKREERTDIKATTFSERIRARNRDLLIDRFEEFLRAAEPEEISILSEILFSRDQGMYDQIEGVKEVPLGEAFGWTLDREETYIRIPKGLRAKVQKYVDALNVIVAAA
jgi:hypothetical protein